MDGHLFSVALLLLAPPSGAMAPQWPRVPAMVPPSLNFNESVAVSEPGPFQPPIDWPDASRSDQPISEPAVPLPAPDRHHGKPYQWGFITIVQTREEDTVGWNVQWNFSERFRVGVSFNCLGAANVAPRLYLEIGASTLGR